MEKGTMQFLWVVLMLHCKSASPDQEHVDMSLDFVNSEHWDPTLNGKGDPDEDGQSCAAIQPRASDIVKRVFAVLPYFDREHANSAFLHRLRGSIHGMCQHGDLLDREVAFFASALTPAIFLQQQRDPWCLLERFHRAIRFFPASHPTSKRSSLKMLQRLRSLNSKLRDFIDGLERSPPHTTKDFVKRTPHRTTTATTVEPDRDDDYAPNTSDGKDLKELIKNLG